MAFTQFVFMFISLSVLGFAFGIKLEPHPATIVIGQTTKFEVKCTTLIDGNSSMDSLISLIVSRLDNTTSPKELATINVFSHSGQAYDISTENITVSGQINSHNESYLSLVWENPDASTSGDYMCEGNGVDVTGHSVIINTMTSVSTSAPVDQATIGQVQNLTSKFEQLSKVVESIVSKDKLRQDKFELIKTTIFNVSEIFNGRRYLLSPLLNDIIDKHAQAMCELFNGYLVEIDSSSEFEFVADFSFSNPEYYRVLTGATDEGSENVWVNRHSMTPVNFTKWAAGSPATSRIANCLYLWHEERSMFDSGCSMALKDFSFNTAYLCEVPE